MYLIRVVVCHQTRNSANSKAAVHRFKLRGGRPTSQQNTVAIEEHSPCCGIELNGNVYSVLNRNGWCITVDIISIKTKILTREGPQVIKSFRADVFPSGWGPID